MEYWGVACLQPSQQTELAKTGDSVKYQPLAEHALMAKHQDSSDVIADPTTPSEDSVDDCRPRVR